MKYYLLLLLVLTNSAFSDYMKQLETSNRLHEQSLLMVLNNREILKSEIASESKTVESNALMKVLVAWELSDGANGVETGDILVEAWIHHPLLVSSWFDSKPNSRNRWLKSQDYLFNGFVETSSYKDIVELKSKLIASLKDVEPGLSKTCDWYLQVLLKLEVPNYENS